MSPLAGPSVDAEPRGRSLALLARAAGIQTSYFGIDGVRHRASNDTLLGVLHALGVEVDDRTEAPVALDDLRATQAERLVPPVTVAWDGLATMTVRSAAAEVTVTLELESGDRQTTRVATIPGTDAEHRLLDVPGFLPTGVHHAEVEADGRSQRTVVLAAPSRLAPTTTPRAARFGVFAPTYALRRGAGPMGGDRNGLSAGRESERGIGDLRDLATLAEWVGDHRGGLVATLPLLPTFLGEGAEPFDPSPYSPVSRLAWSEAYLDLAALPGVSSSLAASPVAGAELVDWRVEAGHVRAVLDAWTADGLGDRGRATVDAWLAANPTAAGYAWFRAATVAHGPWTTWTSDRPAVDPVVECRHGAAQWALDQQLTRLAASLAGRNQRLYLDLPIGTHPEGFDVWAHRESFAPTVSVGAPPDDFFSGGQNWGFPPLHPERSRRDGHAYLRASVAHHLRHAGMLRVDHVMAVHRLWWVPPGLTADQGAYVRYPSDELYAAIAIEASRVGAEVVGEDLGTVPGEMRRSLGRHGFMGMYAAQFELPSQSGNPAGTPRRRDLALPNTHDMATFASFWSAADVDLRLGLGLLDATAAARERAERIRVREATTAWLAAEGHPAADASAESVLSALLGVLGAGPARWVLVSLEDLWAEMAPQNVPGVGGDHYPSWRRRMAHPVDSLADGTELAGARRLLDALAGARGDPS